MHFELTALADGVSIARRNTELYGGLNMRYAPIKEMTIGEFRSPPTEPTGPAWTFISGLWEGTKERTGITVFERTTNPDYPGQLIQFPEIFWFQPTFPAAGRKFELSKDQPLVLDYRLWIHRDRFDEASCRKLWERYQREAGESAK